MPPVDGPSGVFGYVRPVHDADSPLDAVVQRTAVRACARGEGLGSVEIFEESSEAGRSAFTYLLGELAGEAPGGGTVVVSSVEVLGVDAVEGAWRLVLLAGSGATLVFADGLQPEAALRAAWSDRGDRLTRRRRVREAMRSQALRGLVLGRPPYGYAVVDRMLTPHPREAATVKRLFREYIDEGEGFRRIAAGLNRDGIKTRLGRPWTPGSVRTVLKNPAYTGMYRRLGVVVPASHPAIVDRASFGVAQRKMSERRTSKSRQQRHVYEFAGLLRCGRCGGAMVGERRNAKSGITVAYRCLTATGRGTCRAPGYREDAIRKAVREELARPDSASGVAIRPRTEHTPASARQRLEREFVEAVERWEAGEWRFAELVARALPTAAELHRLEALDAEPAENASDARRHLLADWDALDTEARAILLRAAVAEVVVGPDGIRVTRWR